MKEFQLRNDHRQSPTTILYSCYVIVHFCQMEKKYHPCAHRLSLQGQKRGFYVWRGAGETFSVVLISVFNDPPGSMKSISITPLPLWWLTGLQFQRWSPTVKVDETCCCYSYSRWHNFYSQWQNLQCCPVCTNVSFITNCKCFITDCKSDNSFVNLYSQWLSLEPQSC